MGPVTEYDRIDLASEGISLAWAAAYRSKICGLPCGDVYLVRRIGQSIMLAVADGSGSGPEAARAATFCLSILRETDSVCLNTLFAEAHRGCLGTRGAALAITLIDPSNRQVNWAAVGEVEGLLLRGATPRVSQVQAIIQRGGTIGHNLPSLICHSHEIRPGDTIILSSDGVRHAFRNEIPAGQSAETLAAELLSAYGREDDDALALVAKFDHMS